ncbi:pantoate--beta-alanine ligase [Meinhardsimonia xiamenensis]|uniref:pantoate--beta-alanine ligase n=1 Tax=Meinhardsimonia xiamenensis TaxID=990712 RepID=UPI001472C553
MPPVIERISALRQTVTAWKKEGARVGVVPTMGALHEGHLSLVRAAREGAERVIVTIFVNPAQFNDPEDLKKYPRDLAGDLALLAPLGVDAVFAPPVEEVYPPGFATSVHVAGVSEGLCGAGRPGHFDGVATVVAKLFNMTAADRAWFGEKDWQQLQVVRRLARDLDIPVEVIGCPTVREADGLALSSRNRLLSAEARARAPALYRALCDAAAALEAGEAAPDALECARRAILAAGFERVEYLELRAEADMAPMEALSAPARLLAAAWLEGVRLIDNIALAPR